MASSVGQLSTNLKKKNILCYRIDEEKNLYKAFGTVFPIAIHWTGRQHHEKTDRFKIQKSLANENKVGLFKNQAWRIT